MMLVGQILEIMQTPSEIDGAYDYLTVIFGGIFSSMAYNLLSNIISVRLEMRKLLIFSSNGVCDEYYLDIKVLLSTEWELSAGYATVFFVNLLMWPALFIFGRKFQYYVLTKEVSGATKRNIWNYFCRISSPTSSIAIGTIMVQIALNQLGTGLRLVAHNKEHKRLTSYDSSHDVVWSHNGYLFSTNLGKKYDRGSRFGVRECIKLSLTFAIVVGIILNLFSPILGLEPLSERDMSMCRVRRLFFLG